MGKRTWLELAIATEYLPFLSSLSNSEEGKKQAEQFNQTIRNSWSDRGLTELSQQQSLMDTTRRAIKDHLGENHFSLDYIKFDTDEYIQLNDFKQGRVALRNEQVQFIDDPNAIVERAIALLNSLEWSEVAAGLSVITGRRSSELLSTAQFTYSSEWSVSFTGALKRGGETEVLSFEIPTLAPAKLVCQALSKVRQQLPDAVGMKAEDVNSKYGSAVIKECDHHFTDLVPLREGKDNLYTHLFRSVYATIATFWFCPPNVNEVEYKAAIQGHYAILDESNLERRRSLSASRHYSDYEIADGVVFQHGGKRKGVKLRTDGVKVIDAFQRRVEAKSAPSREKGKLSSVRIIKEDKSLLDQIFQQLELDNSLNQSSKMNELLNWVKSRLEHEPIISSPKSEVSLPSITKSQTQPLQGELEVEPFTNDDHQEPITVAASLPDQINEAASPPTLSTSSPLEKSQTNRDNLQKSITSDTNQKSNNKTVPVCQDLMNPNSTASGLEAKIDKLVDVMTQFINLQIQGATQLSTHQTARTKVKATTQAQPKTAVSAGTTDNGRIDVTPTQRTPRNSPLAQEVINNAIAAIIAHNNSTDLHDLKWAITINSVKELVSEATKSQRLVQKAIALRQDEIDQHHIHHQIEPNHNHRHKRKRTIREAISDSFA
ncbi:hypothetical protein C7H19_24925 [Aphanothece hegewaldii CCALA 016]|uniref:Telomere resolvase ResT/TelK catalytic domain-containing protein n=1 Tax=Aphanothece hegewaldii CCALA 016 TaxID=2107694 RepID=A0A2T1LQF5_9CHRO|nr:protelomerase family protein [Aphanothece hegewaldii]PSF27684.1 hypothetical protein C7H19_24925 [Aphanothece hegewaldii CCALA 016]